MKYLDPKADLTFKKIFGNHPKRLISLLNALLPLSEEEQIHEIEYLPTTEELEISGFTDAELWAYDKFWDSVRVEKTLQYDSYQQGMEKGMEKGMNQRSLEIARNLLSLGLPVTQITQATGLTEEEIRQMKL